MKLSDVQWGCFLGAPSSNLGLWTPSYSEIQIRRTVTCIWKSVPLQVAHTQVNSKKYIC